MLSPTKKKNLLYLCRRKELAELNFQNSLVQMWIRAINMENRIRHTKKTASVFTGSHSMCGYSLFLKFEIANVND